MATPIVAPGGASSPATGILSSRRSRATATQHHAGAHNALTLALLYLGRGDLPAARRKAAQALASLKLLQEVLHG